LNEIKEACKHTERTYKGLIKHFLDIEWKNLTGRLEYLSEKF